MIGAIVQELVRWPGKSGGAIRFALIFLPAGRQRCGSSFLLIISSADSDSYRTALRNIMRLITFGTNIEQDHETSSSCRHYAVWVTPIKSKESFRTITKFFAASEVRQRNKVEENFQRLHPDVNLS